MKYFSKKTPFSDLELIARIGIFGTFVGHGIIAIAVNPSWIALMTSVGFTITQSKFIMPIIGIADCLIGISILLFPNKKVVCWTIFWTLIVASMRPISGLSILEFIERSSNFCLPIVLLMILQKKSHYKVLTELND
jgi:hypothetical protein